MTKVQIEVDALAKMHSELERLRAQVTELQTRMSDMVNEQRSRRVRDFMQKSEQPVAWTPCVPNDKLVRLRLGLIAEEFFELLEAAGFGYLVECRVDVDSIQATIQEFVRMEIDRSELKVDFPELVDALVDLEYVITGTHATLGVDERKVFDAVHAANMAKVEKGVLRNEAGKVVKPPGWAPPDIAGVLREQGWRGPT